MRSLFNIMRRMGMVMMMAVLGVDIALAQPQNGGEINSELYNQAIESQLMQYSEEMDQLLTVLSQCREKQLQVVERAVNRISIKWEVYSQTVQNEIVSSDSLLQMVSDFQLKKSQLTDSIAARHNYFKAKNEFNSAEAFIYAKKAQYEEMYDQAVELSMSKATAEKLEELKQKELLVTGDLDAAYEKAKAAVELCQEVRPQFGKLETRYIELKKISEQIKAAEYQPFFKRIKDYLVGLAAVAMILMFFNMLQSKIKAYKDKREQLKKVGDLFDDDHDYPTI